MILKQEHAGESHGNKYIANFFGIPSGIYINKNFIYSDLLKRKNLFFSSNRTLKELDNFFFFNGLINNITTKNPISLEVNNNIFSENVFIPEIFVFRPGHVDYSSFLKYKHSSARIGAEFASARNLIIKSIFGSICKQILNLFNVFICSDVFFIKNFKIINFSVIDLKKIKKKHNFYYKNLIKEKKVNSQKGDSFSGAIEINILNIPAGLGSYLKKIESIISEQIFNFQSVKGIEFLNSFKRFKYYSSYYNNNYDVFKKKNIKNSFFLDKKNGIEGGVSTGFPVTFRIFFKHINTIFLSNNSFNYLNNKECLSFSERSDFSCILKSLIYLENAVSIIFLDFFLEKFGSDNIIDIKNNFLNFSKFLRKKKIV